jgi:hypothetical protein
MHQIHRAARRTVFLAAAAAAFGTTGAQAQTLPSAHDVIERYVTAIGGRARLQALSARHQVADMAVPSMGTMTVETFQARPNRIFTKVDIPGMGSMTMGYDGTTAWANNPMTGPRIISGGELPQVLQQADFDASLDPMHSFPTMQTIGERQIGGHACWNLRMVHSSGQEMQQCFDKETGLLLGATVHQTTQMGDTEATVTFENYQDFDGVRVPTKVTTSAMGQEMVLTVRSLTHEPIAPSVFDLPAEIRALSTASH